VASSTTISGSYTQTAVGGASTAELSGTITANGGISLSSPSSMIADSVLDSSGGNGNILVTGTIDNAHMLTLRSGGGNVTLSGVVGGVTPIGVLKLGSIQDFSANAISATSISQEVATTLAGQAFFNGQMTTTGASGITLTGNSFAFNNVTTTGGGAVSITNSGLLTLANGTSFNLDGLFSQTGAGSVSMGSSITTTSDAISFASPVSLMAAASLNTGAGVGNITLSGSLDGAHTLDLTAGTGNITLQGAIGQSTLPTGLTIHNGTTILVNNNANLSGPFVISSATGPATFNGNLSASAINLSGVAINFNGSVASTSGSISITNSGTLTISLTSPITAATNFTQTGAGTVSLGSNITTAGILSIASDTTLTNNVLLNSGGGNLTLSGTVAGVFDMTLTAGAGDITLSGNIGAPRIGAFTITSANDISAQAITAASLLQQSATGTSTLLGSLDTDTAAGITLIGTNFTSSGTVTTTNGGPLIVTNSGLATATAPSVITLNGGGAFTQNGTGPVNLGGTITTQNATISYASPVAVLAAAVLTSNGGDITFLNTIDGPACLTLTAGSGDVHLNGIVGGATPLGCLTASGTNIFQTNSITSTGAVLETATTMSIGGNITTSASNITLTGNVTLTTSPTLSTSGGAVSITGFVNGNIASRSLTIQTGAGDITLASPIGNSTPFNNVTLTGQNITWNSLGSGSIGVSGTTTVTATNNLNFSGTIYNNGTQIYTAGTNFNFTAGVLTTVSSNSDPITFNTGTIQLGATDLTIDSNAGDITLTALLGTGRNLTVDADTGALNFVQIGAFGDDLNNVVLTSNAFTPTPVLGTNVFATSLTVNSVTPLVISADVVIGTITYNTPVIIQGNITYACGAAGTITFNKRVDADIAGVDTLTFNFDPCGGSVIFNDSVGAVSPLASLSINAATDATFNGNVNLGALTVTNGLGITALNSGITSTTIGGVHITTPTINLAGSLTTISGGPMVLNNSGALTVTAGTSFDISGAFQQTGAGAVSIGGDITTHDNPIQFTGAVSLNSTLACTSKDLTGGDVSFASTIQGAQSLNLTAGSGDISFTGAVGMLGTPLTTLAITEVNNVTASSSIFAGSITQSAGTGLSSFAALTTTGVNGIHLTGSAFTFGGAVTTTTNSGPLVVTNSGTLSFGNFAYTIGGALTQNGIGSINLGGTFTVGGIVSLARAVTLTNNVSMNTSATNQPITFGSTITNDLVLARNLTLNSGSGKITLTGSVGAVPIGVFTITNAGDVAASGISAASIVQTAATGVTTVVGNLTSTGGISLTGTQFNLTSTVTTTGAFSIVNTGPLSLTLGSSTLIGGTFTQSGGGLVAYSGTLATNHQNLTFTNAMTLTGASTLSTGTLLGDITLPSVNGNASLDLTAGGGNIIFGAPLGISTPLGAITVHSVQTITYPQIFAAFITQLVAAGTTTITGPLTTTASGGVSIAGDIINQNGLISALNTGSVAFINSGLLTITADTVAVGGYSQSGGGSVSLGGSITADMGSISFANTVNLTASVALISGPTSGTGISFDSAVTGVQALALTAFGSTITFSGDVGTIGTPLTALTILDADTVLTQGIYAGVITQLIGDTISTFQGPLNASTGAGISLTGTAFAFDNTVTSAGALTLTNTGLATFDGIGSITGALTQSGSGAVQLSSTITSGGAMTFNGPFSAVGTGTLTATNQPITFFNSVDGPGNLTVATGTQDIKFQISVGDNSRLGTLQITTVRNVTAESIKAVSIVQSAGTGLTLFNGDLDTNGIGGIHLIGVDQIFLGHVTTTGSGIITLTNSGTLTTTIGKTFSSNGIFTQNGSGAISLGSTIATTNPLAAKAHINFSGTSPITLVAPAIIDSSVGGGTITFSASSTVNGAQPIMFAAGTGDVDILGIFGGVTRLGSFTITSANDITFQAVTVSSLAQLAGSGTTTLLGLLDTNSPLGMTFIGNNFTAGPAVGSITTTNGGSLILTNQGVVIGNAPLVMTIDGAFIQNGPGICFLGSLAAKQGISFTGPFIVSSVATLDSSGGSGDITFTNRISGFGGAGDLILTAGTGDIFLTQPIGLTANIGPYPVNALNSLTATGSDIEIGDIGNALTPGVTGTTTLTTTNDIDFTGTNYNANTQNYTVTTFFQMQSGALTTFSSNGSTMTFSGGGITLDPGTDLTMNTGGSNLTLGTINAQAGNQRHLILNAGAGTLNVGDVGTQGNGEFASSSFTASTLTLSDVFADAITFSYTTLNATGDIVSTDTPLVFPNNVILQATNIFSTVGTTGADMTFSGTVRGAVNDTFGFTLQSGSGNIIFSDNVGVAGRLSNLIIATAHDVTFAPLKTVSVDFLVQQSGSGTTTFNGPLVVPTSLGILLTGTNFAFNSSVTTLSNGSLSVTNSGTLNFAGTASLSGAFTQNTGPTTFSGSITAGQPISFGGTVSLSGSPSLNTAAAGQTITFQNTVGGSGNLTLTAGNGNIFLQQNAGTALSPIGAVTVNSASNITVQSIFATSIDLISSTGLAITNNTISTTGAAGIHLVGNNFFLNGSLLTTGGGSVIVTNSGLISSTAVSTRIVDGSYTQNGTGPVNFAGSLSTNTGSISFASPVTLLGPSLFNSSAANQPIMFSSTINGPSSLNIIAGGGDFTVVGAVGATTALSNFTVTSAHDIHLNEVGTTASGVLGTLSLTASHDIDLLGTFYSATTQNYSPGNNVNLNTGSPMELTSFGGPIRFTNGTVHLSNGSNLHLITNDGDFSFLSLTGTSLEDLVVNAGEGTATLGTVSPPGGINVITVLAGKIQFSGAIDPTDVNFVSLTDISNTGPPVLITTTGNASFNALGGDVGTLASPILVNAGGLIFAGAFGPSSLANFNGFSSDNTVHVIPSNPPCIIIFNGVIIKNCKVPPTPPGPSSAARKIPAFPFAVPGFDSSYFNLASDYFFMPYFFDDEYVRRAEAPMYWRVSHR
jgi:hypothetical protein